MKIVSMLIVAVSISLLGCKKSNVEEPVETPKPATQKPAAPEWKALTFVANTGHELEHQMGIDAREQVAELTQLFLSQCNDLVISDAPATIPNPERALVSQVELKRLLSKFESSTEEADRVDLIRKMISLVEQAAHAAGVEHEHHDHAH
jgi:hypothetical protein